MPSNQTFQSSSVLRTQLKLSTFYEIGLPLRGPVAAFKKLNNSRFSDCRTPEGTTAWLSTLTGRETSGHLDPSS